MKKKIKNKNEAEINKRDKKVRMGGIIRVLTPQEFDAVREQIKDYDQKFLLDLMLNTGMRYIELQRFVESINNKSELQWFNKKRNMITLPSNATKTFQSRNVLLTSTFAEKLEQYIEIKGEIAVISYQTLDNRLKRWAEKAEIDKPNIIAVKTFRKTWESWLVTADKNVLKILPSQGHTSTVALNHYLTSGFTDEEKAEMIKRTAGWGD